MIICKNMYFLIFRRIWKFLDLRISRYCTMCYFSFRFVVLEINLVRNVVAEGKGIESANN